MRSPVRRHGVTLVEVLVGLGIGTIVLGIAFQLQRFSSYSTQQTLGPQLGLQTASRAALIKFIREIQESIEIVRPLQGGTLHYFMARDKFNQIMVGYSAPQLAPPPGQTVPLEDLYIHRYSYDPAVPGEQVKILENLKRITFTTLSPGALQIHATLSEQGKEYTLLTTIRTRNILSEGEL